MNVSAGPCGSEPAHVSYEESLSFAQRRATAMSNRVAAAHWPWTVQRPATRYQQLDGYWQAEPASLPALDPRPRRNWSVCVVRSSGRASSRSRAHVKVLPAKLLPADRAGVFPVRWWHRLYWQSVRRLLRLPVDGLAAFKGSLKRWR